MAVPLSAPPAETSDPLELHRRHWSDSLDLDVLALVIALHGAQEALRATSQPVFTRHRLSPAEFDVLATLRRTAIPHELTPSALQEAMLITSGGLTKLMLRLETRRLVSRPRRAGDQRLRPIRLLARGKTIAEQIMAELHAATAMQFDAHYTATERRQLTVLLTRMSPRRSGRERG